MVTHTMDTLYKLYATITQMQLEEEVEEKEIISDIQPDLERGGAQQTIYAF